MKAKDLKTIIITMKHVAGDKDLKLNMNRSCVQDESHDCGTIHCFAGWYLIAAELEKGKELSAKMFLKNMGFEDGVRAINKVLKVSLPFWAGKNPKLWGNRGGGDAFFGRGAFKSEKRPNGANSINDIVDHLEDVYWRIKKEEMGAILNGLLVSPWFYSNRNKGGTK